MPPEAHHPTATLLKRVPLRALLPYLLVLVPLAAFFRVTAADLFAAWSQPEYSYGYFIPPVALYWAWTLYREKKLVLCPAPAGLWVVALGLFMNVFGDIAANNWINRVSLPVTAMGLVIAFMGFAAFRRLLPPLVLLFFAVPLPPTPVASLTSGLQLASTTLSVAGLSLLGIPVYQEGNVIDLGTYKLQVVEACSGLRYLFPFLCFGYLFAFWFEKNLWKRFILIASAAPITLLMNGFRILLVGVTVDIWGTKAADGLLHDFEGWIVFVGCIFCMFLLSRGLDLLPFPETRPVAPPQAASPAPRRAPFALALAVIIIALGAQTLLADRPVDQLPPRQQLADFPLQLGNWRGATTTLPSDQLAALRLSDYVIADYRSENSPAPVNFYVAYYASQRRDAAPHSPLICLPGSGWEIAALDQHFPVRDASGHVVLQVNRAIVKNGSTTELVYFWFRERGRDLTTVPQRKWYLFRDSLAEGRTDGALVRVVTPITGNESDADKTLADFTLDILPTLRNYVPD